MNCKPGDLEIVVGTKSNNGLLVEVLRAAEPRDVVEWEPGAWFVRSIGRKVELETRGGMRKFQCFSIKDGSLRPIRDNDGEDETLQWAPVPSRDLVLSK